MPADCPARKIVNPKTGRCVKIDGAIGRAVAKKYTSPAPDAKSKNKANGDDCPSGKIRNPASNRCVNVDGSIGRALLAKAEAKANVKVKSPNSHNFHPIPRDMNDLPDLPDDVLDGIANKMTPNTKLRFAMASKELYGKYRPVLFNGFLDAIAKFFEASRGTGYAAVNRTLCIYAPFPKDWTPPDYLAKLPRSRWDSQQGIKLTLEAHTAGQSKHCTVAVAYILADVYHFVLDVTGDKAQYEILDQLRKLPNLTAHSDKPKQEPVETTWPTLMRLCYDTFVTCPPKKLHVKERAEWSKFYNATARHFDFRMFHTLMNPGRHVLRSTGHRVLFFKKVTDVLDASRQPRDFHHSRVYKIECTVNKLINKDMDNASPPAPLRPESAPPSPNPSPKHVEYTRTNPGSWYSVTYAPSGRARCKGCKKLIAKSDVRLADGLFNGDNNVEKNYHPPCYMSSLRAKLAKGCKYKWLLSPQQLYGYNELHPKHQKEMADMISTFRTEYMAKCSQRT